MGDKVVTLAVSFLVTALVARYLGPESFGVYSYALSVTALFAAAGHMGLSGLVVREIVKRPNERSDILGTTIGLKFIGMSLGYLALLIYGFFYEGAGSTEFLVLAIAGLILLFRPFDVIDFWFQAFIQARYVTIARLSGLALSALFKILFIFSGVSVAYFVGANVLQGVFIALFLVFIYKYKSEIRLSSWRFSWQKASQLFKDGWVIYLGAILAVIYLKVDQVMLRWFEGAEAVGVYAVAAQISEAWYFIPTAIVASFFPKLIKLREENNFEFKKRMQQLFDALFVLAFLVAIVVSIFSEWVIVLFFGENYIDSAQVLVIHIWAAIFIFMRAAFSKWILIENALIFSLITQGVGAVTNISLNSILIPRFGVEGAAYATLISYAFASFFSLVLYKKTRPIFFMMLKSIFCFARYIPFKAIK